MFSREFYKVFRNTFFTARPANCFWILLTFYQMHSNQPYTSRPLVFSSYFPINKIFLKRTRAIPLKNNKNVFLRSTPRVQSYRVQSCLVLLAGATPIVIWLLNFQSPATYWLVAYLAKLNKLFSLERNYQC